MAVEVAASLAAQVSAVCSHNWKTLEWSDIRLRASINLGGFQPRYVINLETRAAGGSIKPGFITLASLAAKCHVE